ncbi:hypothetical protein DV515_00008105 [Chloebia gouldiae]|uniref:Uncharacterized protein n=1 Tax=Chloebia gouldiae TaxID=44316 RepID=A0A3L8SGF9_CHLGU|nr:hypothetical protein DV515_00008105 [Chloebia gouldiae]
MGKQPGRSVPVTPVPLPAGCEGGKVQGKEPRSRRGIHSTPLEQGGRVETISRPSRKGDGP